MAGVCGRYVQASSPDLLAERFAVDDVRIEEHEARYNVAPRAEVPVVRRRQDRTVLSSLRWGLVPSWAKDPKVGDRLINARAESVADKPAYRTAFERTAPASVARTGPVWRPTQPRPVALVRTLRPSTRSVARAAGVLTPASVAETTR